MLNSIVLMGRLTADPELRHTPSQVPVTTFTLACDRNFVRAGEERKTDFIDIVAWRSTAEFVCKYFKKGQLVAVKGSLQTRTYDDKNGIRRRAFEIVAENVYFAESRRDKDSSYTHETLEDRAHREEDSSAYKSGNVEDFEEIDSDEDLPF